MQYLALHSLLRRVCRTEKTYCFYYQMENSNPLFVLSTNIMELEEEFDRKLHTNWKLLQIFGPNGLIKEVRQYEQV